MEELQTFRLSMFQGYEFSYYKSIPLEDTHPYQIKSKTTLYYSKGHKSFKIHKLSNGKSKRILTFDERNYNIVNISEDMYSYIPTIGLDLKTVVKYFIDLYNEFKASDPDYGTYDGVYNRKYITQGKRSLYLHDFIEYVIKSDRRNKILKIKERIKNERNYNI